MIALSTQIFDPDGHVIIHELPSSEISEVSRRVNRIKTLDGGVVINDGGHSAGDRDFVIRWRPRNRAEYAYVQRLVRVHSRVRVSVREGVFLAAQQSINLRDQQAELRLLITEQVA